MSSGDVQRWDLTVKGRSHRVEVQGSVARTISWYVDDSLVATKKTSDDNVTLTPEPEAEQAIGLRFGLLGEARRVTLYEGDATVPAGAKATLGAGGLDLDPEPGSRAARREQRIREQPWRHALLATAAGVAKVVLPVLLGLVVVRLALSLPWPSWDIPWPDVDLPRIPWPDVPLPDWQAPAWLTWVADKAAYVWPVLLALALAKSEITRRRKQDALKAELKEESGGAAASG